MRPPNTSSSFFQWIPLRVQDGERTGFDGERTGFYTLPVPLRVLQRVEQVLQHLPGAHFFVSQITQQSKADPFLLVTYGNEYRVIDCWDEPGFTG